PAGLAVAGLALWLSGRQVATTRHRPDPWRVPEWLVLGAGLAALGAMLWLTGTLAALTGLDTVGSPIARSWLSPPLH
ncbi:hypothetical protein ACPC50_23400, partial [Bacillus subtilis]